ncbi:MAG: M28 family peptidase [Phenylobacterium sp.]|uniref:M28 family metallopeptidase n=1 Tax=Phenylobacterium sp. TaxID=1871053 RepID=UPI0017F68EF9|nr:M28 family metallopeptidase [Phenylobacterium sp.]MBA4794277.1 M28 family peptidase [Phenylobacterium sp.]
MKTLLLAAAATVALASTPALAQSVISGAEIGKHIEVLASDAFEGRAPATPAEEKTVNYLIEQFKAAGLKPAGDLKDGRRAWTQDVPLARFEIEGPVATTVKAGGETLTLDQGEEIAIRAAANGQKRVEIQDAPVVFGGYGVVAPERDWNDFKGMDLKGKVVLVLVNDPDYETGEGDFGGKAMTYYGRWTYKYEEAARQGAAGFLVIHETAPASYGWATVKNSNTNEIFDIVRADPTKAHAPLEGWVQREVAVDLLKRAGLDFEALKKEAQTRAFQPKVLEGVTFSTAFDVDARQVVSKNVVAEVTGDERPDERILYTSHWDHLGVGLPDAQGDTVYNGALDNAAGVATVLEIAEAFAKGEPPARSVDFLIVTAEEKGLLGSEYYAANPLYPLEKTVAVLNLDAPSSAGPAKNFSAAGDAASDLQDMLIAQGAELGRTFAPDPRPEAGGFFRSDHFPFVKMGVPSISYRSGDELAQGGVAAGQAWSKAYTADRYHQPADEYGPDWNLDGMAQDGQLLYALGQELANAETWPEWKAGSEFKAARDASAAARK